jgi:dolichol-phosphate mannosyltransferase
MMQQTLTALPVFNEVKHVEAVLREVLHYSDEVLVVDDGSTDGTSELLDAREDIHLITHPRNRGYGVALRSAFDFAIRGGYDVLVTIDCDGQHEPQRIPQFIEACRSADIVSGSRYLRRFAGDTPPPEDRRRINRVLTRELNRRLGLGISDAFCGFKAYRVPALAKLELAETGYAMPLELWVRAAELGLKIVEVPVPLIYLEEVRSFGGSMDHADTRLAVYREVLDRAMAGCSRRPMASACGEAGG